MENFEGELDLGLKLKMMRLLWFQGFFVRRNIPLIKYTFGKRTTQQYTDIDVLGIRFNYDFSSEKVSADCKTGGTARTAERIFWLSGVMRHFGANRGLFVRKNITENKYVDLAENLNISVLSKTMVDQLEQSYRINPSHSFGVFNVRSIKDEEKLFRALKKDSIKIYNYLTERFWRDTNSQKIVSLISYGSKLSSSLGTYDKVLLFFKIYTLSLLSIAVLEFSKRFLVIPQNQQEVQIRERLMGGRHESYERQKLFEGFYDFMTQEIKKRYREKYPVHKVDFINQLYPEYTKYVIDIVQRLCRDPISSVYIPHILDLVAYEAILRKNSIVKDYIPNLPFHLKTSNLLKPSEDMIIFGERCNIISKDDREKILEKLTGLRE